MNIFRQKWKIICLFGFYSYLALGAIIYIFGSNLLSTHSDSCAYNILAREIIRCQSLVPETFWYSTDPILWSITLPMIALWKVINSQLMLRAIGVLTTVMFFMTVLVCISKFVFQDLKKAWLTIVAIYLIFPSSQVSMHWEQAAYLSVTIQVLCIPALFCWACDDRLYLFHLKEKKGIFRLTMFSLIFVLFAMGSLVTLEYFIAPLAGALVLIFFVANKDHVNKSEAKQLFMNVLYLAVLTLIGFLGYNELFMKRSIMPKQATFLNYDEMARSFSHLITLLFSFWGLDYGADLLSWAGIFSIIKIFVGFMLTLFIPAKMLGKYGDLPVKVRMFTAYVIIHNAFAFFIMLTCGFALNGDNSRMITQGMVALWVLSSYYIHRYYLQKKGLIRVACIAVIFISCLMYVPQRYNSLDNYSERISAQRDITDYLYTNGLTLGYATFWNANNNTVLSDFKVEIAQINLYNKKVNPYRWLATERYFDPEYHTGDTFVMLSKSEYGSNVENLAIYGKPKSIIERGDWVISVYPYNISQNKFEGRKFYPDNNLPNEGTTVNYPAYTAGIECRISTFDIETGASITDGNEGCALFGPYAPVKNGIYDMKLYYEVVDNPKAHTDVGLFDVVTNSGSVKIAAIQLSVDQQTATLKNIRFEALDSVWEHRVHVRNGVKMKIFKIEISKVAAL